MGYLREEGNEVFGDLPLERLRHPRPEGLGFVGHGCSHSFTNARSCSTASASNFVRAEVPMAELRLVAARGSLMKIESR
jgi:hypothetical protein